MNKKKLLAKILTGRKNVKFNELDSLIKAFGFELARINGSQKECANLECANLELIWKSANERITHALSLS